MLRDAAGSLQYCHMQRAGSIYQLSVRQRFAWQSKYPESQTNMEIFLRRAICGKWIAFFLEGSGSSTRECGYFVSETGAAVSCIRLDSHSLRRCMCSFKASQKALLRLLAVWQANPHRQSWIPAGLKRIRKWRLIPCLMYLFQRPS